MRAPGWIMRIPGTLLLAAAALKTWGLGVDPVGRMGLFSTAEVQLAVILFEVFLGVWLWSNANPIGAWLTGFAVFAAFTCITFYLGVVGQTSCGCFGRFSPSPWYAFAVDLMMLAVLAVGRPDLTPLRDHPRSNLAAAALPILCGLVGIAAISSVLVGLAYANFGSMRAAIAYFRGERVSVSPRLVEVQEGATGEQRKVAVEVTNWTDKPIRLVGGTSDCSCTVLENLPVTIGPKETHTVSVDLSLTGRPGIFTRKAGFVIDDGGMKTVRFELTGRILNATE